MRTSNKILLGTFIAIIAILTAVHAGLYTKYKQGDFITSQGIHEEQFNSYPLQGLRSVSLVGLRNVRILPSDSAKLEIEKSGTFNIHYTFVNGVLTIHGDTTIARANDKPERVRAYESVVLYIPQPQQILVDFCELSIAGNKPGTQGGSLGIELNESTLHLGNSDEDDAKSGNLFKTVKILKSAGSDIDIAGKVIMKELQLNLLHSNFDGGDLVCDSLAVTTDSGSSVKLSGKNLAKTTFSANH